MEFSAEVRKGISLFDSVFAESGAPPLLESSHLSIGEMTNPGYFIASLATSTSIPIEIRISNTGLEIGLERESEVYAWSTEQLESTPELIRCTIRTLFQSYFLVERCGRNYVAFTLFDGEGGMINRFRIIHGLSLRRNCERQHYFPILGYLGK
jgi:hypothetical protein